ncbi:hypothetical protein NL676_025370 [Syzygium grande]|nr:hypothetical protein NL676_025370 [Syzygium grande]
MYTGSCSPFDQHFGHDEPRVTWNRAAPLRELFGPMSKPLEYFENVAPIQSVLRSYLTSVDSWCPQRIKPRVARPSIIASLVPARDPRRSFTSVAQPLDEAPPATATLVKGKSRIPSL